MKKFNKKGFTIVEIVIVIAVIAILAAVLIPTFTAIISKANQSVDQQLVDNLNTILRTEETLEGKNLFMHDAVLDLAENGFDLDALKLSDSETELVWEQRIDRFIIVKQVPNNVQLVYCSKADEDFYENNFKRWRLCWKIYTQEDIGENVTLPRDGEQVFSIYWGETTAPTVNDNGIFEVGLDLGYYEGAFNFAGGTEANPKRLVFKTANTRVRGNFNNLQFNAAGMYHIGKVDTLTFHVGAIDNDYINPVDYTHHEYGQVGKVELASGTTVLGAAGSNKYQFVAESGSVFTQSEEAVRNTVGGADYFVNKGGKFGSN